MAGMSREKINRYLISVLETEIEFVRSQTEKVGGRLSRMNSFYTLLMKEFYWTARRIIRESRVFDQWKAVGEGRANLRMSEPVGDPPPQPAEAAPVLFGAPAFRGRILIDMTPLHRDGGRTGIQRVVREIARGITRSGDGFPVFISKGQLHRYAEASNRIEQVSIAPGDVYVMADASWNHCGDYPAVMQLVTKQGGHNVVIIYDLIPVLYPAAFRGVAKVFEPWLRIAAQAEAVIAISKSTADDFLDYVTAEDVAFGPNIPVGWWHLGADFGGNTNEAVSREASDITSDRTPFCLSVGTLEPRKGYSVALAAIETLWKTGHDIRYVIVGSVGWHCRALQTRILQSPEFGNRLFWLEKANDADVRHLYAHAHALVAASFAEGYGLPIIEAAHHGVPAIVSDIPVFREVGNDATNYFQLLDSDDLAARISQSLDAHRPPIVESPLSWPDATANLVAMIRGEAYQYAARRITDRKSDDTPYRSQSSTIAV